MNRPVLVSIALALGFATGPAAAVGGDVVTMEANTDRMGADYRRIEACPNVEACHSACLADSKCDAFTFVKSVHHCYLKGGTPPGPTPNNDTVSGVKMRAPEGGSCVTVNGVTCEPNVDRMGADYQRIEAAPSVEFCQQKCIADEKCAAFTYVKSVRHCWLKNGVPGANPNNDTVSGVKLRGDEGNAPASPAPGAPVEAGPGFDVAGKWVFGPGGESWTLTRTGKDRYDAQETGFAGAHGTATVNGSEFRLDFAFSGGSGYFLGTISSDGRQISTTRYHDGAKFTFVRPGRSPRKK